MKHRLGGLLLTVILGVTGGLGVLVGAQAQEATPLPAPQEGASTPDVGWWNRTRPTVALPTGAPPTLPNPGVPAGSLVVSAASGDASAVTAVQIERDGLEGETITVATLTLREVAEHGANLNSAFAAIEACPITGFWFGGENGEWDTRPAFDCEAGRAPGTRSDDGTWAFDLTGIVQAWSDGDLDPDGVILVEAVDAPVAFRTVFQGLEAQAIGITVEASGGTTPTTRVVSPPATTASGGSSGTAGGGAGSSGGGSRPGSSGIATTPSTTGGAAAPVTQPPAPAVVDVAPVLADLPGPLESLPVSTVGLVLVVAAVAVAAMTALGPEALPAATGRTGRGVSRALARKEPT